MKRLVVLAITMGEIFLFFHVTENTIPAILLVGLIFVGTVVVLDLFPTHIEPTAKRRITKRFTKAMKARIRKFAITMIAGCTFHWY